MKGTGAGWDSILYRIFIIGGLLGVVIVTVGTVIFFDPQGRTMLPAYTGGGCVTVFLLGILIYWWIQFLFAGDGDGRGISDQEGDRAPEISALKSWTTLFEAMVKYGGNAAAINASRRKAGRPMLEWFAWATVFALFPIVNVWLYLFGLLTREAFLTYIRPGIFVIAILMVVRTCFLLKRANQSNQETIFAPLGLSLVETSRSGTVLEGQRNGRAVRIAVDRQHCLTQVSGQVSRFEAETKEGKFMLTDNLPKDVQAALKDLRKAKRWTGVKLQGKPEGVTVERNARGLNLWLYDLWLAERVMEETSSGAPTHP